MDPKVIVKLATLLQRIGEAYYAQGQSKMQAMEHGWQVTAGAGTEGPPPLNLWMAQKLLDTGIISGDVTNTKMLDSCINEWTQIAADRSRKGK